LWNDAVPVALADDFASDTIREIAPWAFHQGLDLAPSVELISMPPRAEVERTAPPIAYTRSASHAALATSSGDADGPPVQSMSVNAAVPAGVVSTPPRFVTPRPDPTTRVGRAFRTALTSPVESRATARSSLSAVGAIALAFVASTGATLMLLGEPAVSNGRQDSRTTLDHAQQAQPMHAVNQPVSPPQSSAMTQLGTSRQPTSTVTPDTAPHPTLADEPSVTTTIERPVPTAIEPPAVPTAVELPVTTAVKRPVMTEQPDIAAHVATPERGVAPPPKQRARVTATKPRPRPRAAKRVVVPKDEPACADLDCL
jgi:hypothetical protein